ncbi:Ubiquinol-cytochrome C reductase iron-sulfur subunit [Caballeronia sordidicola]|uniref:Ubiquinol-cytochrome C reductase iron-sulfur subunit n=1 Tax=Caballeronia sordidicola TaxID=196367 RepID=A0A242MA34_CABSO|nr:Ubiquinol-cytochrome C reductase iron-sulfur subunit [Caballeronia sordidicola]OTP70965.1 Ubiquinol-cytochrome C reductase iron-sulfur subunit [Caballeronia sordidicola]
MTTPFAHTSVGRTD